MREYGSAAGGHDLATKLDAEGPAQLSDVPARPRAHLLRYIPALDGLRGAAVVAVLLFHSGHLTGGYLGVDLFFVLSGYLITSLLVAEWAATGAVMLRAFWSRRARRLLPALLAVLFVVGVASHWFVPPVARGELRGAGLATLGYVANWKTAFGPHGYWQQTSLPSWLQHTWSLAIEEQFYVVWPLVVVGVLGRRRGPATGANRVRTLAVIAWAGAVLSGGLMIGLSLLGTSPERLYVGTDTRAAAIMLGAGLACSRSLAGADRALAIRSRTLIATAGVVAAAVLVAAWTTMTGSGQALYRGGLLMCGVAATIVLLDIVTPGRSALRAVLAIAPLRGLGLISYGLYLWHWPIFQYLHPGRFGLYGWQLTFTQITASIAVAIASYRFIERPFRRGAMSGNHARVLLIASAAVTVVALLVGTAGAIDPTPKVDEAPNDYTPGAAAMPRLMVAGDSVALTLASEGVIPQAPALGIRVVNRAVIGCTIMRDSDQETSLFRNCSPQWPFDIERLRPDVVVVLFGHFVGLDPFPIGDGKYLACDAPWQDRWRQRLNSAIDVLSSRGARVVLVSAPSTNVDWLKGNDPAKFDREQACSNDVLRDVAATRREAAFVDLADYVCRDPANCKPPPDVPRRADGLHWTGDAARFITRWLVPRVLEASRAKR